MRFNRNLAIVLAIALAVPTATPAFAGGPRIPASATSTNVGVNAGCQYFIVCKSSTDPWNSQACNNGYATVIKQCARR